MQFYFLQESAARVVRRSERRFLDEKQRPCRRAASFHVNVSVPARPAQVRNTAGLHRFLAKSFPRLVFGPRPETNEKISMTKILPTVGRVGEARPEHGYFCSWMPYQVGQTANKPSPRDLGRAAAPLAGCLAGSSGHGPATGGFPSRAQKRTLALTMF